MRSLSRSEAGRPWTASATRKEGNRRGSGGEDKSDSRWVNLEASGVSLSSPPATCPEGRWPMRAILLSHVAFNTFPSFRGSNESETPKGKVPRGGRPH